MSDVHHAPLLLRSRYLPSAFLGPPRYGLIVPGYCAANKAQQIILRLSSYHQALPLTSSYLVPLNALPFLLYAEGCWPILDATYWIRNCTQLLQTGLDTHPVLCALYSPNALCTAFALHSIPMSLRLLHIEMSVLISVQYLSYL